MNVTDRNTLRGIAQALIVQGADPELLHHALEQGGEFYDLSSGISPEDFSRGGYISHYRTLAEWAA